jgi:hypothetical protein
VNCGAGLVRVCLSYPFEFDDWFHTLLDFEGHSYSKRNFWE